MNARIDLLKRQPSKSSLKKSIFVQKWPSISSHRVPISTSLAEFKRQQQITHQNSIRFRNDSNENENNELADQVFAEEQSILSSSSSNSFTNRGILKGSPNQANNIKRPIKHTVSIVKSDAYPSERLKEKENTLNNSATTLKSSSGYNIHGNLNKKL